MAGTPPNGDALKKKKRLPRDSGQSRLRRVGGWAGATTTRNTARASVSGYACVCQRHRATRAR
eukprot:892690-Lingulodinium_polyedra.AAC.1